MARGIMILGMAVLALGLGAAINPGSGAWAIMAVGGAMIGMAVPLRQEPPEVRHEDEDVTKPE